MIVLIGKAAQRLLEELVLPQRRGGASADLAAAAAALESDPAPDAAGLLALLALFGVPDEAGRLEAPGGHPRNATRALEEVARGLELGSGLCHTLLGLLLALGHPGALDRARVWLREPPEAAALEAAMRLKEPRPPGASRPASGVRESGIDAVPLAYLLGAQLGDDLGALAYAFSEAHGLRAGWRGVKAASFSPLSRVPKKPEQAEAAACADAVAYARRPALAAARHAEGDPHRDWAQLPLAAPGPQDRILYYNIL